MKSLFTLFTLFFSLLAVGCSASSTNESHPNSNNLSSTSSLSNRPAASNSNEEKKEDELILFCATTTASEEFNETNDLFLKGFTTRESTEEGQPYDEVILLLSDATPVLTKKMGKLLKLKNIKTNTKVEVTLKKDFPMTMSIPPQIPGNSIVQVVVDQ